MEPKGKNNWATLSITSIDPIENVLFSIPALLGTANVTVLVPKGRRVPPGTWSVSSN